MAGRVALVTGGSGGIGRAVVESLARAGTAVAVHYSCNGASAEEATQCARALGVESMAFQADVSDASQVDALVAAVMEQMGGLDVLVNNAGIARDNLLVRMKDDEWDAVLNTNLKGAFHCARAAARHMLRRRWGRIINITSVVGIIGNPGQANYCASKAGLIGLTKALAKELAPRGITVNAVAPGFIATEMTASLAEEVRQRMLQAIPLGFFAEPKDVAAAVAFLASEEARYITGHVLQVDGGLGM
jgi:3-oxoacyl-[acyl-carrier protein] reductase